MCSLANIDHYLMRFPMDTSIQVECSSILSNLFCGKFIFNIESQTWSDILSTSLVKKECSLEQSLMLNVEASLSGETDLTKIYDILSIGISNLQLFVQINWTGPPDTSIQDSPIQFLRKALSGSKEYPESEWLEMLTTELTLDGESISTNIRNLELLLVARAILNAKVFNNIASAACWRLRCLYIHQQILEERSPAIYKQVGLLTEQLMASEVVNGCLTLKAQLELEAACLWLFYGHIARSEEAIRKASQLLKLEMNLVGALGKRTKFQQKELPQLTLAVKVDREEIIEDITVELDKPCLPKDVKLEDDVRLDHIAFSDSSAPEISPLTDAEQAAILATFMHRQRSQPNDKLLPEEILPYVTCLTSQPRVWTIQMSALLQRSKLETSHRRTAERAMMQYESLSASVAKEDPTVEKRLAWVYASYLPPSWQLQKFLAHTYLSLGMVQTALDVFLSLHLWEEVIACYNLLKLRHKAAEVIRQELEKKASVKLYCLLGDATDDIECYRQAWDLSGERSGRAQRHWAMYYFTRKQYAESIPHLEKSLSLNSLQESLWFRLGFAALMEENWNLCATAYRRYCSLESESFEAWNNLAKAYVKTGQKARAFRALQEAVKCNYENWRVWDNLMAVSTDCGQFEEVVRCYHRILDLNPKHIDEEVLRILTKVVVSEIKTDNCSSAHLRQLSLKLFGRLTSQVLNNSTLWQLYAQIAASDDSSVENTTKVAQCLQKAYRAATQGSWERDVASCLDVTGLCVDLAKAYIQCSNQFASTNEKTQFLSSAKFSLKSVITKIEKEQTDLITGDLPEALAPKYKELLSYYELIVDQM